MSRLINRRLLAGGGRRRQANPKFFLDTDVFVMSFDHRQRRSCADAQELINAALTTGLGTVSSQVIEEFTSAALDKFHKPLTQSDCRLYLEEVMAPLWRITPTANLYRRALDIREQLQQEHLRQVPSTGFVGLQTAPQQMAAVVAAAAPAAAAPAAAAPAAAAPHLRFRDCLIIASALATGCGVLFSQSLPHWQRLDSLLIVHPFSGNPPRAIDPT